MDLIEESKKPQRHKPVDITDIIADIKDTAMHLPKNRLQRQEIMRKIAEGFQRKQGNFFFGQIYDILETVYTEAVKLHIHQIVQEIEDWLSNDKTIESLGEECGFYYYRLV